VADPNLGLVARYRFETLAEGVLKDDSGKGNDLRVQGTVTLAPGKVGKAVVVSRTGYPQSPRSESLELGGAMTLEAWIKPERAADMRIFDRQTIGGNDGFMLDTHPKGHLRLIIGPGQLRDPDPLAVGQWSHVAATYSEETGEARLYRNGQIAPRASLPASARSRPWPDRRRPATSDSVSGAATKARCISTRSRCLGSKGRSRNRFAAPAPASRRGPRLPRQSAGLAQCNHFPAFCATRLRERIVDSPEGFVAQSRALHKSAKQRLS
jgi:hypothetical protein